MTDLTPLDSAELVPTGPPDDPMERWLGGYSPETKSAYTRDLRQWLVWMEAQGRSVLTATPGDVIGYVGHMQALGLAASSQARKVSCIASYFTWAREEGLTDANPMPSPKRRPKAPDVPVTLGLTRDVAHAVLAEAARHGTRARALVTMLVYCGMRISEATGLDVGDLRDEHGHRVLRVRGKGGKVRDVPAEGPVVHALAAYLDGRDTGPMFTAAGGGRWDRREAWRLVDRIGKRAGVKLYPHLFRHTAVTLALEAGAPPDRVKEWVGHASLDTTMRYAQARASLEASPAYDLARFLAED